MRFIVFLCLSLLATSIQANSTEFPGRKEFPGVNVISKEELLQRFDQVQLVDARSNYEFETIHINSAVSIPVSNRDFAAKVRELRRNTNKPIVFYCNGRSCFKSYKAAEAAQKHGIQNVMAYDAGMFEWAQSYPDKSSLLGVSPINPADLLDKNKLKSHMISPKQFSEMVFNQSDKVQVLDIRDLTQRATGIGYFIGMEQWISIDNKVKLVRYLRQARQSGKTLLIYDGVGKQVRWLQYTLEKENIKNYFFMAKGALGFFEDIIKVKN